MKFTMELKDGYPKVAKKITIDVSNYGEVEREIKGWLDSGFEVILTAKKEEVTEDDF